jgi:hypothetical protein
MATRDGQRGSAKEHFWRKVVGGFDASRTTVRAWCMKHRVSEPSFYAWRRELARRDTTAANTATRLLRVEVAPPAQRPTSVVIIELADGLRLHVAVDQLAEVLKVLEARPC